MNLEKYIVYPNVKLGKNIEIGDYSIIGYSEKVNKNHNTIIGFNSIIRSHSVIYYNNNIGTNFVTGHGVLLRENNKIGNHVVIGSNTVLEGNFEIGNNVNIGSNVVLPKYGLIGNNVFIGPNVSMADTIHPRCVKCIENAQGPIIKSNAKIAHGVTINPMITIGENSLIGAGAVVTRNIPDNTVAFGSPAKVIGKVGEVKCPFD